VGLGITPHHPTSPHIIIIIIIIIIIRAVMGFQKDIDTSMIHIQLRGNSTTMQHGWN
jgi:hypothetical protein